ncbi:MAG TPA: response regulator transcription factor [Pirellulaceae bacterium]|jgi:DNA-binding response OmpR family regulator|nr:response regulator transcription factor [Pirellulaceae bacterium]
MKVLIAEDDPLTLKGLADVLEAEGYRVLQAADGKAALEIFEMHTPDFVCLDIMMPNINGYDLCQRMRSARPQTPIVFITAKSEGIDKVLGLELGADDFIVKPFGVKEVVARIRAVTRRCHQAGQTPAAAPFRMCDLLVIPTELRARRGDTVIELSLRDVTLLELFYRHRSQVLDRGTIFHRCWGQDYLPNSRTLDQHISQLRKRIEADVKSPCIIRTVHNAGYRFDG